MSKCKAMAAFVLGIVLAVPAWAAPDGPIGSAERAEVVQKLGTLLKQKYVFPDVAERVVAAIEQKEAGGGYRGAETGQALGAALGADLRALGDDQHFMVRYDPRFHERPAAAVPSAADLAEQRKDMEQMGYGIEKLERLPGNVGYMELRGFGPVEAVAPALSSAMSLLTGSSALIIDLRRNGGGSPDTVAWLMSHFFAQGDDRHLNDMFERPTGTTRQFWTVPAVTTRYDKPVYVLTSPRTFSGGEECAYDFQTQKRATIVGETTGGGSNPVGRFSLGHGLVLNLPVARSINPVTQTNWEHTGVKPDIAVPAAQAQQTAYVAILRSLVADAKEAEDKEYLQRTLALAEKGEREAPVYKMPVRR
jgi:hypothetical protein